MTAKVELIQGITDRERFHEYFPVSVENGRKMLKLIAVAEAAHEYWKSDWGSRLALLDAILEAKNSGAFGEEWRNEYAAMSEVRSEGVSVQGRVPGVPRG